MTYAFFSFDEESRNEFRQKYHSMGLKEKENCMEQLKEFMKAMQQKGPKVIIATLGKKMEALGMMDILGIDLES